MAEVITFEQYRPPRRYDSLPWTHVSIQEAPDDEGPWTELEVIALDPVDADPENPAYRSFTTQLGTAPELWYRVEFVDADGDTSQPTVPVQNLPSETAPLVTAYATVSELARILKVRAPSPEQEIAMQRVLDTAALEIDAEVGRTEPYEDPPALVVEVNLERAVEHWQQQEVPFGIIFGGGEGIAVTTARDTWQRHAHKLAPLKQTWGLA